MKNEPKSCKVTIFGTTYVLESTHSQELIKQAAGLVDLIMQEIALNSVAHKDVHQIAVLTSIRLAGYLFLLEAKTAEK
jgi:cell division protein ZapA (FtsZ GTPase activity inhibitor)